MQPNYANKRLVREKGEDQNKGKQHAPDPRDSRAEHFSRVRPAQQQLTDAHDQRAGSQGSGQFSSEILFQVAAFYAANPNGKAEDCYQACRYLLRCDEDNLGNFVSYTFIQLSQECKDKNKRNKISHFLQHIFDLIHSYACHLSSNPGRHPNENKYIATIIHRLSQFRRNQMGIQQLSEDVAVLVNVIENSSLMPGEQAISNTIYGLGKLAETGIKLTNIERRIEKLLKKLADDNAHLTEQHISNTIYGLGKLAEAGIKLTNIEQSIEKLLKKLADDNAHPTEQHISNTIYGLGILAEAGIKLGSIEQCIAVLLKKLASDDVHPKEQEISSTLNGLVKLAEAGIKPKNIEKTIAQLLKQLVGVNAHPNERGIANAIYDLGKLAEVGIKPKSIEENIEVLLRKLAGDNAHPNERDIANAIYGLGKLAEAGIKLENIVQCIAVLLKKLASDDAHPKEQEISITINGLVKLAEAEIKPKNIEKTIAQLLKKLVGVNAQPNERGIANAIYDLGKLAEVGIKPKNIEKNIEVLLRKLAGDNAHPNERDIANAIYGLGKLVEAGIKPKNIEQSIAWLLIKLVDNNAHPKELDISLTIYGLGKLAEAGIDLKNLEQSIEVLIKKLADDNAQFDEQNLSNAMYGLGRLAEGGIKPKNIEKCIVKLITKYTDGAISLYGQGYANVLWGLAHYREVLLDQNLLRSVLNYAHNNFSNFSTLAVSQICVFLASRKLAVPIEFLTNIKKNADQHQDSSLEIEVFKHLSKLTLPFEKEKVVLFKPVDFYLELDNGKRKIILEVDGSSHDDLSQKNIDAFQQELFECNSYEVIRIHHQEWNKASNKVELLAAKLKINQYATLLSKPTEKIEKVNQLPRSNTTMSKETLSSALPSQNSDESQGIGVLPKLLTIADATPFVPVTIIDELAVPPSCNGNSRLKVNAKPFISKTFIENKYASLRNEIDEMVAKGIAQYEDTFELWYVTNFAAKASGKETVFVRAQHLFETDRGTEALEKLTKVKEIISEKLKSYELKPPSVQSENSSVITDTAIQEDSLAPRVIITEAPQGGTAAKKEEPAQSINPLVRASINLIGFIAEKQQEFEVAPVLHRRGSISGLPKSTPKNVTNTSQWSKSKVSQSAQYCWATLINCCRKNTHTQVVIDDIARSDMKYKKRV